ncbi:universal stress protein [Chryseobacterium shandongense]|uniref:Universal stress protein n=1 Tax=Chryseobacterium shandongense TaxID=1493872 RepID=A0AAD0YHK2_9FLAO|nr:universal stress protein [Chryseobacterium shandongense]AZA86641.1 universal stress protein [Chryseobacterium shandongense]AZA95054.1 universal stress protein [Chryseobacterium shandongense]
MRTIVVPTDYSKPARNAAFYSLHLAAALKSNLHLCHAFGIPVESPMLGQTAWALYEYPALQEENSKELKKLGKALEEKSKALWGDEAFPFHPSFYYVCEGRDVDQVINDTAEENKALLIVMGMNGAGMLTRFFFGSNSIKMINNTKYPLLLIPEGHKYKGLTKIAFATDLNKKDIKIAQSLLNFAKYFDAELLITHIIQSNNEVIQDQRYEHAKEIFLKELEGRFCYNCIYSENIDYGLDILKNKDIDMLIMGHHYRSFFENFIQSSHAVRQAGELEIPLMVIPENGHIYF